jgi:hypothetical protein
MFLKIPILIKTIKGKQLVKEGLCTFQMKIINVSQNVSHLVSMHNE